MVEPRAATRPGLARGEQRLALGREWARLMERVRSLDGFADFLRAPRLASLLPAAGRGAVVVVNVSWWRCDALVIRPDGVTVVPLTSLSLDDVDQRVAVYLDALRTAEGAGQDMAAVRALQRVEKLLTDLQAWMWDTIAEPILAELGHDRTPPGDPAGWPRLWWCPTGSLTLLPLHSAGHHRDPDVATRRAVLDRVVSSYAPTLRALVEARRPDDTGDDHDTNRLLLVEALDVPGEADIRKGSVRSVLRDSPLADRVVAPGPAETGPAEILSRLPGHRWVHFGCHGFQDLDDPSQGGLVLQGGNLAIADISARRFRGDFAALSACKTAVGGRQLPDELITLSAALHYAGYRHVVGTLWSVDAEVSAEVFASLYTNVGFVGAGRLTPGLAPVALHHAVHHVRRKNPTIPTRWAPFIHIGP